MTSSAVRALAEATEELDLFLAMEDIEDSTKGPFKMAMEQAARLAQRVSRDVAMGMKEGWLKKISQLQCVANNYGHNAGGLQNALGVLVPILESGPLSAAAVANIYTLRANILAALA